MTNSTDKDPKETFCTIMTRAVLRKTDDEKYMEEIKTLFDSSNFDSLQDAVNNFILKHWVKEENILQLIQEDFELQPFTDYVELNKLINKVKDCIINVPYPLESPRSKYQDYKNKCVSRTPFQYEGFYFRPKPEDALAFSFLETIIREAPDMNPEKVISQLQNAIWFVQTTTMNGIAREDHEIVGKLPPESYFVFSDKDSNILAAIPVTNDSQTDLLFTLRPPQTKEAHVMSKKTLISKGYNFKEE